MPILKIAIWILFLFLNGFNGLNDLNGLNDFNGLNVQLLISKMKTLGNLSLYYNYNIS